MNRWMMILAVLAAVVILVGAGLALSGEGGSIQEALGQGGEKKDKKEEPANRPPTAAFTAIPDDVRVKENVTFNAAGSKDQDGEIVEYRWDFGDGYKLTNKSDAMTDPTWSYFYAMPGKYTVELVVIDDGGNQSAPATHVINVKPADVTLQANNYLAARLFNTDNVTFELLNNAKSVTVNVSFTAMVGALEPCSASVWLENPFQDLLMNETADLGTTQSQNYGFEFSPTQLSFPGEYELTLECSEGRVLYSYTIVIKY